MKNFLIAVAATLICAAANAQAKDTVIVNLAKTSKIIFTIEDPEDIDVLKHYDFQQLFKDVLKKIEDKKNGVVASMDSTANESATHQTDEDAEEDESASSENEEEDDDNSDDDDWRSERRNPDHGHYDDDDDDDDRKGKWDRTWQAFNFDLGTNNFLNDGEFPSDNEIYAVRPWGSWYVGLASVQRSRLAKKLFLEWGLGMSWYTFKFQDDNVLIQATDDGVVFSHDPRDADFRKSKLSMSFVQASLIPVLDFGDRGRKPRFWDGYNDNSFRIGFGPYVAYRISSHSKIVYNDGDGRERDKERDSFYLNNFRYGARLQIGYRSTDLFFNYDMNELFQEGKGPKLNAFSFGVIF